MRAKTKERGMTLIETTVILAVITILSGMLAPSILQFIEDSKVTRARNDVQAIANGILRFYQDTGHFPVTFDSIQGSLGSRYIDVLVSDGNPPRLGGSGRQESIIHADLGHAAASRLASNGDVVRWAAGQMDYLDDHLIKNRAGFLLRGPNNSHGWNGPYLNSDIGTDPWGNQYMVNAAYLDSSPGVADAMGYSKSAVYVLCAGPNQVLETPFTQPIVNADIFADDIGTRIR
jgi:type II secretory pathway pseudopilin PulG